MEKLRILFIGAHPDDCDISGGGTAVKFVRLGHTVKFISATNGCTGHYEIGGGELVRRRYAETQVSAKLSGIEYEVFDIANNGIQPDLATREKFIRAIREFCPDMIITHRLCDYHPDHRITAQLVQDSSYAVIIPNVCPMTPPLKKQPVICFFNDNFKRPYPFQCDVVVDIDDAMDMKLQMYLCQESQAYEWLPYTYGKLDEMPAIEDKEAMRAWQLENSAMKRSFDYAEKFREQLIAKYGEAGKSVKAAEGFEISEYGYIPNEEELKVLFPF